MKELIVIITAASPILELRGAIPLAMGFFGFSIEKAIFLSFLGNILPIIPLLIFLEKFSNFLIKKSVFFQKFFDWLFEKTRKKFKGSYLKWGKIALVIFVAIPFPFTGAWTGTIASFLFGIKKKEAFGLITLGVLIAGIIVLLFTNLGINILK
ncbi:MAG: COG2426 family protein [Minisyncoccia bacterium]